MIRLDILIVKALLFVIFVVIVIALVEADNVLATIAQVALGLTTTSTDEEEDTAPALAVTVTAAVTFAAITSVSVVLYCVPVAVQFTEAPGKIVIVPVPQFGAVLSLYPVNTKGDTRFTRPVLVILYVYATAAPSPVTDAGAVTVSAERAVVADTIHTLDVAVLLTTDTPVRCQRVNGCVTG